MNIVRLIRSCGVQERKYNFIKHYLTIFYNQIVNGNQRIGELKWIHHRLQNVLLTQRTNKGKNQSMLLMKDVERKSD